MSTTSPSPKSKTSSTTRSRSRSSRLSNVAEDPMGSVISASVAVIASFGLVLSGIWVINLGFT